MTAKSVLVRPQGMRSRARAPSPPLLRHWILPYRNCFCRAPSSTKNWWKSKNV